MKNKWVIIGLGGLAAALLLAYSKRNVPAPAKEETSMKPDSQVGSSDISKRKELVNTDMQFVGMGGVLYTKPTNLIPDVYGNYHNADGMGNMSTTNISEACKCAGKHTPQPTMLANFR